MKTNPLLLIACFLLFVLSLLVVPLWVDPDATSAYNVICKSGDAEVLSLTQIILGFLPCEIIFWKIFQLLLIGLILFLFSRNHSVSILGLVGFFPIFLLSLEDDLIAFPFLFLYGLWVVSQESTTLPRMPDQSLSQRVIHFFEESRANFGYRLKGILFGILLSILLGMFVWKGSFLIGLILIAYFIHPGLSVVPSLVYLFLGNFNNWGGSSEAIMGYGFLAGQIGIILLVYSWWKYGFIWKKEYWVLASLEILVLFQPKWGEWLIIPLVIILAPLVKNHRVKFFGYWMLILLVLFTVFTAFPNQHEVEVIQLAVDYQSSGNRVLTDWGVGHYFEYYGGIASQKGGYLGFQDANGSYWIGPERDCFTILSANALFFQSC